MNIYTLLLVFVVLGVSRLIWNWLNKPNSYRYYEMDARHDLDKMP